MRTLTDIAAEDRRFSAAQQDVTYDGPSWRDLQKKREALLDERAAVYRAQSTAQAVTRPTGDPVALRREWEDLGRELAKHPEGSFTANLVNSRRAELAALFLDHRRWEAGEPLRGEASSLGLSWEAIDRFENLTTHDRRVVAWAKERGLSPDLAGKYLHAVRRPGLSADEPTDLAKRWGKDYEAKSVHVRRVLDAMPADLADEGRADGPVYDVLAEVGAALQVQLEPS